MRFRGDGRSSLGYGAGAYRRTIAARITRFAATVTKGKQIPTHPEFEGE